MPLPAKNLLADAASPYLIQHKDNPVHWRAWGRDALDEAKASDRPILLSVGYAACHWCHVMAHESFEHPETADLMNALFVNIKVDREERPDIDQIYMNALHALGEQGGWPLTMFLTPDGEPFWGGTYFPREARYGRPSFRQVLEAVATTWRDQGEVVRHNTAALRAVLAPKTRSGRQGGLDRTVLDRAAERLLGLMDPVNGGTSGAPKFPQAGLFELFWRAWRRSGNPQYRNAVHLALRQISLGGIYDHIGGGFARYAVDERWLVPHFEKMLYDNAQLIDLLTHAWLDDPRDLYRQRVAETIAWAEREMRLPEGAFASSLDADSEGVEGRFYVWTPQEIAAVLEPDEAALFRRIYDISDAGNWEGVNIPNLLRNGPVAEADAERMAGIRRKLLDARERRVRPGRDDKILADWNGLMIAAMVRAALAFDRPEWLGTAQVAFDCIVETMSDGDRLAHARRGESRVFPGLSTDYGAMIRAALTLHEATGERRYLDRALGWAKVLEAHHWIEERNAYALAADDAGDVIVRLSTAADDALPSGNALAADALVRLWLVTGDEAWRDRADRLFEGFTEAVMENIFAHAGLLNAFDTRLEPIRVAVVIPSPSLLGAVWKVSNPNRVVSRGTPPQGHPAAKKFPLGAQPVLYVCRGETCSLPMSNPQDVTAELQK